jgi:hypothetical protein
LILPKRQVRLGADRALPEAGGTIPRGSRPFGVGHEAAAVDGPATFVTGGVIPPHGAMIQKPLYHGAISIHGSCPSPDSRLVATTGRGTSNVYLIDTETRRVVGNRPNPQARENTNPDRVTSGVFVGREPQVLRSLALKGRRFDAWAEIEQAIERATAYWNAHKHPFIWGRRRRHRTPRRLGIAAPPNFALI